MEKDRVDKMLVHLGLAQTRSKATQMISRGEVYYDREVVKKASLLVEAAGLEVTATRAYVGRGAYKLLKAIENFALSFEGKVGADVGASTGGFTQVALEKGAKKIFAIDVGHDQLDPLLVSDERVVNLEKTNIRECSLGELVDFAVVDLSFISLETVFEDITSLLKEDGEGIFLVKPQFELDKKSLGKKGVVKDPLKILEALEKVYDLILPQKICVSPIKGKEGNKEFLFYFIKGKSSAGIEKEELRSLATESE